MCFYSAVTKTCKLLPCFAMDGHTVDGILIEGDAMYVKTFDYDTIPDAETLSLTYLPDRVHWPTMAADPAKSNQYLPTASEK